MLVIDDEAALHVYLEKWVQKRLGKAVFRRHFLATVLTVTGAVGQYIVTVRRLDEDQPDPNTYLCSNPGYVPQVDDIVDVLWFDDTLGYVMWPLSGTGVQAVAHLAGAETFTGIKTFTMPYKARAYRNAAFTLAAGFQHTPMDTANDPNSNISGLNGSVAYTCPVAGWYLVVGLSGSLAAGTRAFPAIYKNGVECSRGSDTPSAGQNSGTVSDIIQCAAGDTLAPWVYSSAATVPLAVGSAVCYFSVHYLSS